MPNINQYVKVKDLEEAYALNKKKSARVLGGMTWLRLGRGRISTAIDLSGLGLDGIRETGEEFIIGCMTSLHTLETDEGMNAYTNGAVKESLRHIVGVPFRNCATVGGSIFGRFGFSDVLTLFMALDTQVELFPTGRMPLETFAQMGHTDDILANVIVKKVPGTFVYLSQRNAQTDFPVLTCAASVMEGRTRVVIGARPGRAKIVPDPEGILTACRDKRQAAFDFSRSARESVHVEGNMRGSASYRALLVEVLTRRALFALGGLKDDP